MKKITAAAIVVLSLVLAAPAAAEPFTPELEADYAAALAWWGVASPPQCASVTRELLPIDEGEEDGVQGAARASQPAPTEWGVECSLRVYANYLAPGCLEQLYLRHEVGHMLGLGHSADPASIMAPSPDLAVWCPGGVLAPIAAPAIVLPSPPLVRRPTRKHRRHARVVERSPIRAGR